MKLSDKTAVITGASRGLGAGLAEEFCRRGLKVALCSRTNPAMAPGERVFCRRVDVREFQAVRDFACAVADRFGSIDLWINNAGVLEPIAPLRDASAEAFRAHIDINLVGVFHGTQAFIRHLRARSGFGVLVNISSGAARRGYAGWSAYCAAKAGVDRLSECVQLEEGIHTVRVHSVAPGIIETGMQELIRACSPDQFPEVERFREIKKSEAFNTCAFVASELLALAFDPDHAARGVLVSLPYDPGRPRGGR